MSLRHSFMIVAPQLENCCASVGKLARHGYISGILMLWDIFMTGWWRNARNAPLMRNALLVRGVSNGKIDGRKLSQWRLHVCIYCIYKIGFSEKQNIAATFAGGGDNI